LTYARSDRETFIAKRVDRGTVRDGIAQAAQRALVGSRRPLSLFLGRAARWIDSDSLRKVRKLSRRKDVCRWFARFGISASRQ
jgi:hypothetical protein